MKPNIYATIMDFFASGLPVVQESVEQSADTGNLATSQLLTYVVDLRSKSVS